MYLEDADGCLVRMGNKKLNRVKGRLLHIAILTVVMNDWCTLSKSTELCRWTEYRLLHMNHDSKSSFLEKTQH